MSFGKITRVYEWEYKGYRFRRVYDFPKKIYYEYKKRDHFDHNFEKYANEPTNRKIVSKIAKAISEDAARLNLDKMDTVMVAVSFVQSLPYTSDCDTTGYNEYVRYPIETLVDYGGDCEDTAILMAVILRELGYGCVLLMFEQHVAVGVKGSDSIYGSYFECDGGKYFYLETTGKNWDVGEIPDEYKSEPATIIRIR